jgi:predicted Rossmann fold flavoprotein
MSPTPRLNFDVVILGAGAAGLMCAIEAGKRGHRVALIDAADRVGKKILISGGGRCNFTNIHCTSENFISANPHFAKSALAGYSPQDFIDLVESYGIAYHEKKLGQLFCNGSAREIVEMLLREAAAAGVQLFLETKVAEVQHTTEYKLITNLGEFNSNTLVVATGGLSIPKMGATGFGYDIARKFGINVIETWPALAPFVLSEDDQRSYCDLMGVTTDVVAAIAEKRFEERMLITHRGLSGPAILQVSSYWRPGQELVVDMAPQRQITAPLLLHSAARNIDAARTALRANLPARLADRILDKSPPEGWSNANLAAWEHEIHHWKFVPRTTEGYTKAEVTAGGVDTADLSAKTMESKFAGLYFIGEVVDVTGQLGGFNFQWAWASGAAAGRSV